MKEQDKTIESLKRIIDKATCLGYGTSVTMEIERQQANAQVNTVAADKRIAALTAACKAKDAVLQQVWEYCWDENTSFEIDADAVRHALDIQPADALKPVVEALRFIAGSEVYHERSEMVAHAKAALATIGEKP